MKSLRRGKDILKVRVQGVSNLGIWLYAGDEEYFLSYKSYPWFRNATVAQIYNVEFLFGFHLRWPDLDIDLELDSLRHPGKYPLVYSSAGRQCAASCVREKSAGKYGKKK